MSQLRKASRKKAKIRLGLSAVSGGGKTYSAILIAKGLTNGDLSKVAIIDTENGSADLYAHLGEYNVLPLVAPYTPERYIAAIKDCEKAGMEVIVIDSISHEWDGKGGCLEIVESLGGKYQDWKKVTPRHQSFLDAILQSSAHIITTVRRKQDYEMVKEGNKISVQKAGLKELTREGFEYELTTNLNVEISHYATPSKDRTNIFAPISPFIPSEETGKLLREWCESGVDPEELMKKEFQAEVDTISTKQGLVDLYNRERLSIDARPWMQQIIAAKRDSLPKAPVTTADQKQGTAENANSGQPDQPAEQATDLKKEWADKLAACKTQKQLVSLYQKHKADVDANPLLQQLIADRRNAINSANSNKPEADGAAK